MNDAARMKGIEPVSSPKLLVPDTPSLRVSVHPSHEDGDLLSVAFTDARDGQPYLVALDPALAAVLATLIATGLESPRIGAEADQIRAQQRENGHA